MRDDSHGRTVIIGGSAEARALARALPSACVVLPEPERVVRAWPSDVHAGALPADWLVRLRPMAIIEAAHPCDAATAHAVARAARSAGVPHLQLVRPAWRPAGRDRWVSARDVAQVARRVPAAARILTTLGRAELPGLRAFRGEVLARVLAPDPGRFPLRRGRFVVGRGPFTLADEVALLRALRIDWLVLRNAGGSGGWPKLAAARRLGVGVAMVARPARPPGPRVATTEEALAWLARQCTSVG